MTKKKNLLLNTIKKIEKDKFITADFAIKLLRSYGDDTAIKSHIICPYIIDWWNITGKNGYKGFEICYFGNFEDQLLYQKIFHQNLINIINN